MYSTCLSTSGEWFTAKKFNRWRFCVFNFFSLAESMTVKVSRIALTLTKKKIKVAKRNFQAGCQKIRTAINKEWSHHKWCFDRHSKNLEKQIFCQTWIRLISYKKTFHEQVFYICNFVNNLQNVLMKGIFWQAKIQTSKPKVFVILFLVFLVN